VQFLAIHAVETLGSGEAGVMTSRLVELAFNTSLP